MRERGGTMRRVGLLIVGVLWLTAADAPGQPKPPPPKDQPKVLVANPLGLVPGKTTKVVLRGLKLDTASAQCAFPKPR